MAEIEVVESSLQATFRRAFRALLALLLAIFAAAAAGEDLARYSDEMFADIIVLGDVHDASLNLTVRNPGPRALLVRNDFCFDGNVRTRMLVLPELEVRGSGLATAGHLARKLEQVAPGGEYRCSIPLIEGPAADVGAVEQAFLVWQTGLFVGDTEGHYTTRRFSGTVPVTLPLGTSRAPVKPAIDEIGLIRFRARSRPEVIE